jgi:hypothetical protein
MVRGVLRGNQGGGSKDVDLASLRRSWVARGGRERRGEAACGQDQAPWKEGDGADGQGPRISERR